MWNHASLNLVATNDVVFSCHDFKSKKYYFDASVHWIMHHSIPPYPWSCIAFAFHCIFILHLHSTSFFCLHASHSQHAQLDLVCVSCDLHAFHFIKFFRCQENCILIKVWMTQTAAITLGSSQLFSFSSLLPTIACVKLVIAVSWMIHFWCFGTLCLHCTNRGRSSCVPPFEKQAEVLQCFGMMESSWFWECALHEEELGCWTGSHWNSFALMQFLRFMTKFGTIFAQCEFLKCSVVLKKWVLLTTQCPPILWMWMTGLMHAQHPHHNHDTCDVILTSSDVVWRSPSVLQSTSSQTWMWLKRNNVQK